MVNAGLQVLGIKAPPPPLVKSTIPSKFPLDKNTLSSISKEEEEGPGSEKFQMHEVNSNNDDKESKFNDKMEINNLPAEVVGDQWYNVINAPFENLPATNPVTNCKEANVFYLLTLVVRSFYLMHHFLSSCC